MMKNDDKHRGMKMKMGMGGGEDGDDEDDKHGPLDSCIESEKCDCLGLGKRLNTTNLETKHGLQNHSQSNIVLVA